MWGVVFTFRVLGSGFLLVKYKHLILPFGLLVVDLRKVGNGGGGGGGGGVCVCVCACVHVCVRMRFSL
jgi:hypothetical protein